LEGKCTLSEERLRADLVEAMHSRELTKLTAQIRPQTPLWLNATRLSLPIIGPKRRSEHTPVAEIWKRVI
jgi:hypothetical protein